ncbi:hypothetical protein BC940DRAFT_298528 [Gongronella butleri]|nr:hypothetical protein BC940DRAFT_298528 [Gongronella butleri]
MSNQRLVVASGSSSQEETQMTVINNSPEMNRYLSDVLGNIYQYIEQRKQEILALDSVDFLKSHGFTGDHPQLKEAENSLKFTQNELSKTESNVGDGWSTLSSAFISSKLSDATGGIQHFSNRVKNDIKEVDDRLTDDLATVHTNLANTNRRFEELATKFSSINDVSESTQRELSEMRTTGLDSFLVRSKMWKAAVERVSSLKESVRALESQITSKESHQMPDQVDSRLQKIEQSIISLQNQQSKTTHSDFEVERHLAQAISRSKEDTQQFKQQIEAQMATFREEWQATANDITEATLAKVQPSIRALLNHTDSLAKQFKQHRDNHTSASSTSSPVSTTSPSVPGDPIVAVAGTKRPIQQDDNENRDDAVASPTHSLPHKSQDLESRLTLLETQLQQLGAKMDTTSKLPTSTNELKRRRTDDDGKAMAVYTGGPGDPQDKISSLEELSSRLHVIANMINPFKHTVLNPDFPFRLEDSLKALESTLMNHEQALSLLLNPLAAAPSIQSMPHASMHVMNTMIEKQIAERVKPLQDRIKQLEDQLTNK